MSRPWMPLWISSYLAKTAHLRALESGAYLHLIMHYWQNGGLPNDDRQLATIAKVTDPEWKQYRSVINAFFYDGWKHERIDHELSQAEAKYQKRAAAGRKGGKQKPSNASSNATMFARPKLDNHPSKIEPSYNLESKTPSQVREFEVKGETIKGTYAPPRSNGGVPA